MFGFLICLCTSIMMFSFSIAIWKYEKINLINGCEVKKVTDKKGLAKLYGINLIIMGMYTLLFGISFLFTNKIIFITFIFIYTIVLVIQVVIVQIYSKKYYRND